MGFWDFVTGSTPAGIVSDTGQKVVAGVFQGVGDLIDKFHLSPEQAQQFKLELARMELETTRAQIDDIQSARQMQMATRSNWPGTLTFIVMVGFFTILGIIIFHGLPNTNAAGGEAILLLLGSLTAGFSMALSFWLGSTNSGHVKDQMLYQSSPAIQASVTSTTVSKSTSLPAP